MKRVDLDHVEENMEIALDVFDYKGNLLVKEKTKLTSLNIIKLRKYGIPFVYISDEDIYISRIFDSKDLAELLRVLYYFIETSGDSSGILKKYNVEEIKLFESYNNERGSKIAYGHVFSYFINRLIKSIFRSDVKYYDYSDYRSIETYVSFHALNVTCLSLITGVKLGLEEKELTELGVGAMLCDLKMELYKFVEQNRELNDVEKEEMQQHTYMSFDMMRKNYGISSRSAGIAFQHHERIDGSGYPKRLREDEIGFLSMIVSVCDVYDAFISDRPFRKAYRPDEAWEYINSNRGIIFDEKAVDAFLSVVPRYYPGTIVELSDGKNAVIAGNNEENMENPKIKLIEKMGKSDIILSAESFDLNEKKLSIVNIVEKVGNG